MKNALVTVCLLALSAAPLSLGQFVAEALTDERNAGQDFMAGESDGWSDTDNLVQGDYLCPPKGKIIATTVTGIPFVGLGEVAYGITNRLSVGVLAGELGNFTPGYGLRFRYVLAQPSRDFRVYFKVPVIYYPKARTFGCPDCDPWFLTWPTVNAEWHLANGTRVWTGVGVVAAACATTVLGGDEEEEEMAEGLHEGVWNTIQLGISRPLTRRISFQFEAAVVLKGLKLAASHNWLGGPPVILTTGFSYAF